MKNVKKKYDQIIDFLFQQSHVSTTTQTIYKTWIIRLCRETHTPHPLDIPPQRLLLWYSYLFTHTHISRNTLNVVRAALRHFYTILAPQYGGLSQEDAQQYNDLFHGSTRHQYVLPESVSREKITELFTAMKGKRYVPVFHHIYATGHTVDVAMTTLHLPYSISYLQKELAKYARRVKILHGFGLRGLRASGIIHRIQHRTNDQDLVEIYHDTGLSWDAFARYLSASGCSVPSPLSG